MADTTSEQRKIEILLNAAQANASIKDMGAAVGLLKNQLSKMSEDDPRREQMKKDFQELKARVKAASDEINGFVKSEQQLREENEQLVASQAATVAAGQKQTASYREIKEAAGLLGQQLEELSADDPGRDQLIADYQELKTRMGEAKEAFEHTAKSAEQLRLEQEQLAESNRQLVATGQQAGASLTDMKSAAGLLEKQLHEMSTDDPGRAAMIRDFQLLQQRIGAAKDEVNTYVKTEEELRIETEKLNQENAQVVLNGKKVSASFNEMDQAGKLLEKQLKDLSADDPGRKKLLDDYKALQDRIEGVKKEMGEAQEESSVFKEALAFAGVAVGAEAVLEGVKELGAEIVNTTKEVAELRGNINTMTGATGAELDGLTTSVLAVSRTFGKDFNEVLVAGNTLSKQMGVSQQEAMRLIQQGFLAGADAGGDFLDQVKEYAPQFKDAGFAAQDFIGHISQSATQGIFSDKGADVVKEFGLRIREQTKATTEAMQAAFGSDFTKQIFDGINNGSITVEQALQKVGKELDETKIPASQLQTVIADVFGGPGEDAGIDYLKSLKNVGKGVDDLVDKTNVYTQRQERLLNSQTELAEAQNELTKEFEGGGTVLDTLTNKSMTVLYTLLASLGATFKELFQPIEDIWAELGHLAESMGWVSEGTLTAKTAGQALGEVFRLMFIPTRLLWGVISDLVKATVEWAMHSESARNVLELIAAPVQIFYELLSNGPAYFQAFSAAAEASFGTLGRAWKRVKEGDFGGAKDEFAALGKNAGDAYREAFAAATAKKVVSSTSSVQEAGDDGPARAQGGDGLTDAARAKAAKDAEKAREAARKKLKAEQDKADQERLNSLKEWIKNEGDQLDMRNLRKAARDTQSFTDEEKRRYEQQQKIYDAATKQVDSLTGLEADYTEQVTAIVEERELQLRELQAKFNEQDEVERKKKVDEKIAMNQAESEEALARLALKLADGTLDQEHYDEAIYQAKQAARDRELALVKLKNGEESAEYKKLNAEKLKEEAAHTTKTKALNDDLSRFKKGLGNVEKVLNNEGVVALEESLGKQTVLYKAFKLARKVDALANIGVALWEEVQEYWKTASKMGPIAGPIYGVGMSGLAVLRAGTAAAKINGYAKGGATGDGVQMQRPGGGGSMWDVVKQATGLGIASNGKLMDEQGLEIAGVVHKNEYVIPAWMRQDPQVLQVEDWLETRRQRGYAQGGPTTEGDRQGRAAGDVLASDDASGGNQQLVQVLASLDQRLRLVEDWPTQLEVVLDLLGLERDQEKLKKVRTSSAIRSK
ncbi:hypothetical protein GO988_15585 [Hymenobacter sp. HMF4947]|uniref:Phage tail tape measure protein domain-containing protein n=1 Tax=Hymenobacter ginkgonis TaxID=2682976 RepID=A0A7K1TH67_9BACT|nr:phage tail tape measure protein [Hymenobacter ginkgonis]MVN77755.1 hypothetical protein [Hymenobacter ginkgonis]